MRQIATPSGTRDSFGAEVRKKRALQRKLMHIFASSGYEEIMTPALEYHQTYELSFAQLDEREMYKFIDENGQILALRMDMTAPIARVASSKFKEAVKPLRFCYASNVYKVRQAFGGRRSQVMDCGIECIGQSSLADLEVILLALEVLDSLGIENYTLELSSSRFFWQLAEKAGLDRASQEKLADLIDRKSMVELEAFLKAQNMDARLADIFLQLPWLAGGIEAVETAADLVGVLDESLVQPLDSLLQLYTRLLGLDMIERISFDMGKIPHKDYYTGIIFEGFVEGVGTSVLSGGRYDDLLGKFGQDLPACGFSVKLDYLLDVIPEPEEEMPKAIIYTPQAQLLDAFARAGTLKGQGYAVTVNEGDQYMEIMEESV